MNGYDSSVYAVLEAFGQMDEELYRKQLDAAYMKEITDGRCSRLFEINEFTKDFSKKENIYDYLEDRFQLAEIQVIVDIYTRLAGKKEKLKRFPGNKPKLTRHMVIYLCDLVEENKIKNSNNEYICEIDSFNVHSEADEKIAEGGDSMFLEFQPQGIDGNPYRAQIEELNRLVVEKNQKIKFMEKRYADLEFQFRNLDQQVKNKQIELENAKTALESEYKRKITEFEREVENKRSALAQELSAIQEEERFILENKRRESEEQFKVYYDNEYLKAQNEVENYISQQKIEADLKAKQWYEDSIKANVSDYLKEKDTSWKDGHREFDDIRQNIIQSVGAAKLEGCNEASRIQREFVEQLNSTMAQFGANMDKWRDSMYIAQFADFASWASKYFGFVDRFDKRIIDNMDNGEISPDIVRLGKTLVSLRNQLERAMLGMGLRCFYPQVGTKYDPVYHEVDVDYEVSMDAEITECKNPGVEMGLADASNTLVLSKAEVNIKE